MQSYPAPPSNLIQAFSISIGHSAFVLLLIYLHMQPIGKPGDTKLVCVTQRESVCARARARACVCVCVCIEWSGYSASEVECRGSVPPAPCEWLPLCVCFFFDLLAFCFSPSTCSVEYEWLQHRRRETEKRGNTSWPEKVRKTGRQQEHAPQQLYLLHVAQYTYK
jgi:hypothetical protein